MEIGRITGATRVIGKSQGYYGLPIRDEAQNLGDLPHMLETHQDSTVTGPGTPCMVTAWLPSPDELVRLAAGAPLYLTLVGRGHPPVMLSVGDAPKMTVACQHCDGSGYVDPGDPQSLEPCPICEGRGELPA